VSRQLPINNTEISHPIPISSYPSPPTSVILSPALNLKMSSTKEYIHPDIPSGTPRPLKIIHIGAGVTGINFARQIKTHFPNFVTLTIYEKNSDVGGTWFENRYPGCACDIPIHSYTFTWALNPHWSRLSPTPSPPDLSGEG
jgi:hypothetical protein